MADKNRVKFSIDFDEKMWVSLVTERVTAAMEKAAKKLISIMEKEALMPNGGGPGKAEWRQEVASKMDVISRKITQSILEYTVGYTGTDNVTDHLKGMIVDGGIGPAGRAGHVIMAGPQGRSVFDANLAPKRSTVAVPYPTALSQPGNEWVENSLKQFEGQFADIVNAELADLGPALKSCFSIRRK